MIQDNKEGSSSLYIKSIVSLGAFWLVMGEWVQVGK